MITARQILIAAHSKLIIVCKLPCWKCCAVRRGWKRETWHRETW